MYLLGVILVANLTQGYLYSIIASFVGVLTFNYFFTVPYYSLQAYRSDYPVTFSIMLLVALITSTLTAKTKKANHRSELREKHLNILYGVVRKLLVAKSLQQVVENSAEDIRDFMNTSIFIATIDTNGKLTINCKIGEHPFDTSEDKLAYNETFQSGNACGYSTELFSDLPNYYFPICGQSGILGVVGIHLRVSEFISEEEKTFLDTFGSQIALALERERLYIKQENSKLEIVKEQLRSNLLRALSHDLRTPLTGILGSVTTLIENDNLITESMRIEFLKDIEKEAIWLYQIVENTLHLTRIEDGNIKLNKELLPIDEIIGTAVERVKKRSKEAVYHIKMPEEFIMIPVDGILIEQVLVNLLNNAIQHSLVNPKIEIVVSIQGDNALFEIADNGIGLKCDDNDTDKVFDRFYTTDRVGDIRKKGIGLGLYISREIIRAHSGQITASNRPTGGALFEFTIPIKDNKNEENNISS